MYNGRLDYANSDTTHTNDNVTPLSWMPTFQDGCQSGTIWRRHWSVEKLVGGLEGWGRGAIFIWPIRTIYVQYSSRFKVLH